MRRAKNRNGGQKILKERGVIFTVHNNGAHIVVNAGYVEKGQPVVFDFWPGTGKYHKRFSDLWGRGIFNLLKEIKR